MEALRADWRESIAEFKAEGAKAREQAAEERAKDREAAARSEAEAARERAKDRVAIADLKTTIERNSRLNTALNVATIAAAATILGLWLRQGG